MPDANTTQDSRQTAQEHETDRDNQPKSYCPCDRCVAIRRQAAAMEDAEAMDAQALQPDPPPTLRAYRSTAGQCWMVDATQAQDAAKVRQLFGTDHLPTAFTLDANPFDVGMALARLNPGHRIVVEGVTREWTQPTAPGSGITSTNRDTTQEQTDRRS